MAKNKHEGAEAQPFETTIDTLSSLVETLEAPNTSLAESLTAFEKGVALIHMAQTSLIEAEQKVNMLTERTEDSADRDGDSQGSSV